jgi:hypothetical protein
MHRLILGFVIVLCCVRPRPACIAGEADYWARIKGLEKKQRLPGDTELLDLLTSLTEDQTLTALRQFAKDAEEEKRADWGEMQLAAMMVMHCYPKLPVLEEDDFDRLSDRAKRNLIERVVPGPLSDEEFAKLSNRMRTDFNHQIVPGRLCNEAFEKLIAAIGDRKDGTFFRYALVGYLAVGQKMCIQLSTRQKERTVDTYLVVASDRESPSVVRSECCDRAKQIFENEYRRTLNSVRHFLRTATPERRSNLDTLLKLGQIKLTAKTIEDLAPWRQRILRFRDVLGGIQKDPTESETLKKKATVFTEWIDRLPIT